MLDVPDVRVEATTLQFMSESDIQVTELAALPDSDTRKLLSTMPNPKPVTFTTVEPVVGNSTAAGSAAARTKKLVALE